jgi:hypothetical protein
MNVTIYILIDPRNGAVRYIGKTLYPLRKRLREHIADKHITPKNSWIKSLLSLQLVPLIEELEKVVDSDDKDWQSIEDFWIKYLRFIGCDLLNMFSGGIGGRRMADATKQKLRIINTGKKMSSDAVHKMRLANLGRRHTDASKEKNRLAHIGYAPTQEARDKISKALLGKKRSPESMEKCRLARIGSKHTDETRRRFSEIMKKRWELRKSNKAIA